MRAFPLGGSHMDREPKAGAGLHRQISGTSQRCGNLRACALPETQRYGCLHVLQTSSSHRKDVFVGLSNAARPPRCKLAARLSPLLLAHRCLQTCSPWFLAVGVEGALPVNLHRNSFLLLKPGSNRKERKRLKDDELKTKRLICRLAMAHPSIALRAWRASDRAVHSASGANKRLYIFTY